MSLIYTEPRDGDIRVEEASEPDCRRWDTFCYIRGAWRVAVPCCLHTSGPRWEAELEAFKAREGLVTP